MVRGEDPACALGSLLSVVARVDLLLGTGAGLERTGPGGVADRRALQRTPYGRSARLARVPHLLLAAAEFHDKSKAPFFISAGVLVAWALLVSAVGIRSTKFPASKVQGVAAITISAALVALTAVMAVVTAKTPPPAPPYETGVVTNGVGPAFTPVNATAKPTTGPIPLAANPTGQLAYNTTALTAASSNVTIEFTNKSPLPHNVTIANAGGKVLGATPTFHGGTRTLSRSSCRLGTYTFYCSVPGHEEAGMKGTLVVR